MVAPPIDRDVARAEALGRSAIYALLSHTIAYPTSERLTALRKELRPFLRQVAAAVDPSLGTPMADLLGQLETPVGELQQAYTLQFTHIVSPDCPTNETAYSGRDAFQQAQAMADVAGFFRAHGLQIGGPERERPDHIGAELEFMCFVARQEANALDQELSAEADACSQTQDSFLRDHLGCWGAQLGGRMALTAAHPFYRSVGALLAAWIPDELAVRGVTPAQQLDEAAPMAPSGDEDACGDDCPALGGPLDESLVPIDSIEGEESRT